MEHLDQIAFGVPVAGDKEDARSAGHHALLLHLNPVHQRQIRPCATWPHDLTQRGVELLMLKPFVFFHREAIKAGGKSAHAAGHFLLKIANHREKLLADDLLGMRPGQSFQPVTVIKAALLLRAYLWNDSGCQLAHQVAAAFVRAAPHHGRCIAGVQRL